MPHRILSRNVYIGPPSFPDVKLFEKPEPSKSVLHSVPLGTFSHQYGEGPSYYSAGRGSFYFRTANNLFKFNDPQYGPAFNNDDRGMGGWLDAGQRYGPKSFEYVSLPRITSDSGAALRFGERPARFHYLDTHVPKYIQDSHSANWPKNKVGYAVSKIENLRQHLMNYFGTEDFRGLASHLRFLGYSPEDIGYLAVGFVPEDFSGMMVTRAKDGRILLSTSEDIYEAVARIARELGIDPVHVFNESLGEEITHIWRGDIDDPRDLITKEIEAKLMEKGHYEKMAKGSRGDPRKHKARIYEKLAALKAWDAETTPERYSKWAKYQRLYSEDRESLEMMLELEAREEGMKGKNVQTYVQNRMEEIGREIEGKPEIASRLEKIALEESNEPAKE